VGEVLLGKLFHEISWLLNPLEKSRVVVLRLLKTREVKEFLIACNLPKSVLNEFIIKVQFSIKGFAIKLNE
jgi:hypothetical protein